jgi:pimeloyl-ACP methyl ester carboxylesterase
MDLYYREYGSGPPLVILHGLLGAGGNWHTLARRVFGATHRVLVPDQRNHGRSPHGEAFDYATLAEDVEDFMNARGLSRTALLGHSMGGKVAMEFALTRPERVERLVVVDIAPRAYPDRHRPILDAMRAVDPTTMERLSEVRDAVRALIPDPDVVELIVKNVERGDDGRMAWAVNLDAIEGHYRQIMDGLDTWATWDGRALFVRGERSDYVREEDMETIRAYFPNATLDTVPDAGHWVHADHPAAFARTVRRFLGVPDHAPGGEGS